MKTKEQKIKELEALQQVMNQQAEYHRATADRYEKAAIKLGGDIVNLLIKR